MGAVPFTTPPMETETAPPKTCLCKCGKHSAIILILLIAGVICWHIHRPLHPGPHVDPKIGTMCTVQFRRDALGAGANIPVSPTVNISDGASVSIGGQFQGINHEAILLEYDGINAENQRVRPCQLWIPKSSILLIEYDIKTK
jgi:hypothetical protein